MNCNCDRCGNRHQASNASPLELLLRTILVSTFLAVNIYCWWDTFDDCSKIEMKAWARQKVGLGHG